MANETRTCCAPKKRGGVCGRVLSPGTKCPYHSAGWAKPWTGPAAAHIPPAAPVVTFSPQPETPGNPRVTVAGQDFEVTWTAVNVSRYYRLTDSRGRRYDTERVAVGSTITGIRAARRRRNDYVLDERGWRVLFVEDGNGGLIPIRAGTPEFRAAANEALAERGALLLSDADTRDTVLPVEIPVDYLSQREQAASLLARFDEITYEDPVRVPVPGGELFAAVFGDDLYRSGDDLIGRGLPRPVVFGKVTIGRSTYTVTGLPGAPRVCNEAGTKAVSRRAAQAVRDVIEAAWLADGPHAELRDTAVAANLLRRDYSGGWAPDEVRHANDVARPHLLRLGTAGLPTAEARAVAVTASDTFQGTVQELWDVSCAVAGLPVAAPRV